jgi:hypothetical protein
MTVTTHLQSSLQHRFEALSSNAKAAQWVSFLDAIDAGDMGWHPYYLVLAPMYERGVSPFDAETAAEQMEPRVIDLYSVEDGAYLEALGMQPAA